MRGLLILGVLVVLAVALWPLLRSALDRIAWPRLDGGASRDELVKDPICGTYVVRSRAIRNEAGGRSVYFCSPRCAERFSERERLT
jgi:YHS domain-containing protein